MRLLVLEFLFPLATEFLLQNPIQGHEKLGPLNLEKSVDPFGDDLRIQEAVAVSKFIKPIDERLNSDLPSSAPGLCAINH